MAQKYAFQGEEAQTAKAFGRRLPISTKDSVMVCKAIRGKKVARARDILEQAVSKERPIRYGRFSEAAGHKPGIGPGRYPVKTAAQILKILNSAEANAQHKGLGSSLVVEHAVAHQASRGWKYGRQSRRKEKSTHIEIFVRAVKAPSRDDKKKEEKTPKKEEKKQESKKEEAVEKKAEKKPEPAKPAAKKQEKTDTKDTKKKPESKPTKEDSKKSNDSGSSKQAKDSDKKSEKKADKEAKKE